MFDFLKKKISSLFSKKEEKPKKKSKIFTKKKSIKIKNKKTKLEIKNIPQQEILKEEAPLEKIKEKEESFFSKLKNKLLTSVLKEEEFNELFNEFEITLLENNVALEAVDAIRDSLSKDLVGISIKSSEVESTILSSLKETISNLLIEPPDLIKKINSSLEPYKIIFFGINGTGKTTTIAKLANYLKSKKISVVLAAADTFRAASIEQLQNHADKLKIPIIKHQYNSDPTAVAFDAIKYAEKNKIQCVLIDTAGRMYTKENLLKEMEKIVRVTKPNLKIFVGESITGNDVIEQAKTFNETIGIDGIILSKADIDEKAGTILSVSYITKKPIYFLGTGQNYSDLTLFTKKEVLKNLGLE